MAAGDQGNGQGSQDNKALQDKALQDKTLKERLDKLSGALEAQRREGDRQKKERETVAGGETGRAMSLGFRVLSEFVAGILAGGAIGWLLDTWFSTSPLFLLVFGALGTAAGFMNVYKIASRPTVPSGGQGTDSADAQKPRERD